MPLREPAQPGARRARSSRLAVLAVVIVGLVGALCVQALGAPSSLVTQPRTSPSAVSTSSAPAPAIAGPPASGPADRRGEAREQPLGASDGRVTGVVTVFDDGVPAVAKLDPALLDALREAAAAAGPGVTFTVTSGWRSPAYQEQLLREAVAKYGSLAAAARWVATPATSAHVSGDAVDLGSAAAAWLSRHGAPYGLCQIYGNEPWHFELRPNALDHGCPARYVDPAHDPRMGS